MRILRHHLYDGGGEVPEGKSTIGHGAYSDGADKSSEIGTLKNLSEGTVEKPDRADPADPFQIVGIQPSSSTLPAPKKKWYKDKPVFSLLFLAIVIGGCLCCKLIMTKDPTYMDLMNYNRAPDREFLFGTDTMGRDIFSMIWYGGRISLFIGLFSTLISTMIAVVFGGISGIAPQWLDTLLMRLTEILLSIPNLLLVILLQAILGTPNVVTISVVIGVTSWTSIAKVVRTEVRQIRSSEYVIASRCMAADFSICCGIIWRQTSFPRSCLWS